MTTQTNTQLAQKVGTKRGKLLAHKDGQTGFWLETATRTRSRCVSQVSPVAAKSQADDFTSYEKFLLKAISIRSNSNISKGNF